MENRSRKVIKALIAFDSCLSMFGNVHGQNLAFKTPAKSSSVDQPESGKLPLIEILDRIEQNYNVSFAYQKKFLSGKTAVYRALLNEDLEMYLKEILSKNQLDFKRIENIEEIIYIVSPLEESKKTGDLNSISDSSQVSTDNETLRTYKVYGTVKFPREETPVPGANVLLKG